MSAGWSVFVVALGAYLDIKLPKTEHDTAKKIASLFRTAVATSTATSVPGSFMIPIPLDEDEEDKIATGFLEALDVIKRENVISKHAFTPLSEEIIKFWLTSIWTKTVFPTALASVGSVIVSNQGSLDSLNELLYDAFNAPPTPVAGGVAFATRLSSAFSDHMKTIKIRYTGVTGNGAPITKTVTGVS